MTKVGLSEEQIIARIERLPISAWYARILATVAAAHFFDAFDSLTIAFILPVLVGLWKITPGEIGLLISAGFAGQLLGAIALGWAAEKYGRQRVLQFSLLIMAAFAAACALAWSYTSLLVFRALQGVGLGGEVDVCHRSCRHLARRNLARSELRVAIDVLAGHPAGPTRHRP